MINPGQVSACLGRESGLVVIDCRAGLDPDHLAALAGTLRAGGLLVLLTPTLADWPELPDPAMERFLMAGQRLAATGRGFLRRFVRLLRADPLVCSLDAVSAQLDCEPSQPAVPARPESRADGCRTADQARAVAAVQHVLEGHRRRPLVLLADRGRGKSAALGLALAGLPADPARRVLVTAPHRGAIDSLLRHAGENAPHFLPPADLLREQPPVDLLLVDEAAGIPLPMLERLLQCYPRIAFASTVHGYEGTGRGFVLRFEPLLDRLTPGWQRLTLETPIRWAANDPLEGFLFRSLLLDAMPARLADDRPSGEVTVRQLDREALAADDDMLRQLFGLLVDAHYRTRPSDLRQLLDGKDITVHVALEDAAPVGVVLVVDEGRLDPALADAIWLGRRRPRGHLLAQSLGAHCGVRQAASLPVSRVMRIAVHANRRHQGIGRRLLQAARDAAKTRGNACFGTSFGATIELLRFWRACGLRPVRIGLRADAASGARSVVMLQGLSGEGETCLSQAVERFQAALPTQLQCMLRGLDPALAANLLGDMACPEPDQTDWLDAAGFALAERDEAACVPALQRVLRWLLSQHGVFGETDPALPVCRFLQGHELVALAAEFHLPGRRGVTTALREALAPVIRQQAPAVVLEVVGKS
nr:GNAT family N-acetyltransferase [Methylonatrum kenyense]